jgi:integrase
VSDVEMTDSTLLVKVGEMYLARIARPDSGKAERTVTDYGRTFRRYIDCEPRTWVENGTKRVGPSLRGLTLAQVNNPQRLRGYLEHIADHVGAGAAKSTRSVLMNILSMAVDNGALTTNALRQVNPPKVKPSDQTSRRGGGARDTKRALSDEERVALLAYADAQAAEAALPPQTRRKRQAVADLLAFMAGTGVRITEARTLRCDHVEVGGQAVRLHGTKSKAALRRVDLPSDVAERLRRRRERRGGVRVPSPPHDRGEQGPGYRSRAGRRAP